VEFARKSPAFLLLRFDQATAQISERIFCPLALGDISQS